MRLALPVGIVGDVFRAVIVFYDKEANEQEWDVMWYGDPAWPTRWQDMSPFLLEISTNPLC